jgi:pilus assembly protein CpaB
MRLRIILIAVILVILVAIVVVVVLPTLNQSAQPTTDQNQTSDGQQVQEVVTTPLPTNTPIVFVNLVVAVQELPRGIIIPKDAVALRPWPQDVAPFNGISNVEDVIGKRARTDIFREQPILSNMVVDDLLSVAHVGSDAAAVLPDGLRAVSLPVDRITMVAYAPQDGDRVDLIISMLFVDVDEAFQSLVPNEITLFKITDSGIELGQAIEGRVDSTSLGSVIVGPSERQRPRLVTQMTIQDALIIHVGNFPADGRFIGVPPPTPTPIPENSDQATPENGTPPPATPTPTRPDIITIGVSPQEAVVLTWLIEAKVPVTLALRSAGDTGRTATTEVTLDYLMGQYGITLPGKRPFTIEPAIRSIRQLIAGSEISLSDATSVAPVPAQ